MLPNSSCACEPQHALLEEVDESSSSLAASVVVMNASSVNEVPDRRYGGGVLIYVRLRDPSEKDFIQILTPASLSFESFIGRICFRFKVRRSAVRKVVKLPDILLCTTEDVSRLKEGDRLEVVLNDHDRRWTVKDLWRLMASIRTDLLLVLLCVLLFDVSQNQHRLADTLKQLSIYVHQDRFIDVASEIRRNCRRPLNVAATCSQPPFPCTEAINTLFTSVKQSLENQLQNIRREINKINPYPEELMFDIPKSLETVSSYLVQLTDRFKGKTKSTSKFK
ncbi:unnamed protein product [Soboliphyme baturini]|uniref:SH3_10 domain-containing protein n=1 Tax=Soboliphyme baturini TaxID=241478 RepID=A0A183IIU6_9BILA|nr:unnamed protein product [Soboliphyme baturini]